MSQHEPRISVLASFSGAGGVERMLVNLLQGFAELGRPVDLLTIRTESPHLQDLPASVRRIDLGARHSLAAAGALARHLRSERPAVLLAAKDRAGRAAVLARKLAQVPVPIVMRLGTDLSGALAHRHPLRRWLRTAPARRSWRQIEHIIAVSEGVADDTARVAGLPRERISVIRNPVITASLAARAAMPCPHPWLSPEAQAAAPVILGAGRLERQKDFPTLLRAFASLRARRPVRLVLLGEGAWRERLTALAKTLGVAADVDLAGFRPNPYPFLASARLFALSSRWEGSPNVLTEAMALGTPVVATDCPSGPREILAGGRYGPLVPMGDVRALATALAQALDAPLAPAVLKAAVQEYAAVVSARRYLAVLDRVAEQRG
ncbi:MAG: glycosyltransferase [Thiohalocapsa sp.]|uniref:glycosyltransferase n=1 Tax=Thiohalocapsa sp. TaxID=2497641 RepID=UPI0025F27703|nr:glycosyltransferase [Thiohalocapsa sp.]MCG6942431.1 glycosyltransferase [Thiohalocapsa sp.]